MISGLLDKYYHRFQFHGTHVLILLAVFVGLATAFGAMGFTWLIRYFNDLAFGLTDQVLTEAVGTRGYKWWLPVIPMLGGLLVGPIVYLVAKEAKGHGVPEVMASVATSGGIIRGRVAAAKVVGTALAERARAKDIKTVCFDRNGFRYHGRLKALAEAVREAGLKL